MTNAEAQGSTVLVTGANRGLGLEFARQYAADDYSVIATARNPEAAAALHDLAAHRRGRVSVVPLDVTDQASVQALARELQGRPIDLLIHNAGVLGEPSKQEYGRLDSAEFHLTMAANVFGVLALTDALRTNVIASSQKKIVGIASAAGIVSFRGFGGFPFYCISKTAMNKALQCMAAELAGHGVTVGMVAPGVADTDMRRAVVGDEAAKEPRAADAVAAMRKVIARMTPENSNVVWNFDGTTLPW
jgi:NAD(P)-dependent dehydrogenase (short-subunit alcohol dehydrogenase family)